MTILLIIGCTFWSQELEYNSDNGDNNINKNPLYNSKSPQYLALEWMVQQNYYENFVPTKPSYDYEEDNNDNNYWIVQRYVVAVLYFAFNSNNEPNNSSWTYQSHFLSSKDVCDRNMERSYDENDDDDNTWTFGIQCNDDDAIDMIGLCTYLRCFFCHQNAFRRFSILVKYNLFP